MPNLSTRQRLLLQGFSTGDKSFIHNQLLEYAVSRRTNEQIFLDKLTYMVGDSKDRVSSRALKEALSWDEDRYNNARAKLIKAGVIRGVQGGPGGSLELLEGANDVSSSPQTTQREPVDAFVSYSHSDSRMKTDLLNHLTPLGRLGLIKSWHDGEIKPGAEWEKAISGKLKKSRIIILLISADFIASEFCYDKELEFAMRRHSLNQAVVLPVILRPCMWQDLPFGRIQALPKEARAITLWPNIDEAYTETAKGVRVAAQELLSKL